MVEIGHRPILWHIMQHYAHFGFRDFVICLGYKGGYIKKYFSDALAMASDLTIDFATNSVEMLETVRDDWRVTLIDTGQTTQTGGRLQRVREHVGDETFLMTYGDGVSDVDLDDLVAFHRRHGRLATVTAVTPAGPIRQAASSRVRIVTAVEEKPQMSEGWINGGFFVLEPGVFDYIPGDVDWARQPLEQLARDGELTAYCHDGFWLGMDTMRDMALLNSLWDSGQRAMEARGARDGRRPSRRPASTASSSSRRRRSCDDRGFFSRTLDLEWCERLGLETTFVHHNQSRSARGVLRGLHVRIGTSEAKLVRCARGTVDRPRRRPAAVVADVPAHRAARPRRRAAPPRVPAAVRRPRLPGRLRRRRRVLPALAAVRGR